VRGPRGGDGRTPAVRLVGDVAAVAPPVRAIFCSMAGLAEAAALGDGSTVVLPLCVAGQSYVTPPPGELAAATGAASADEWRRAVLGAHALGARVLGGVETLRWDDATPPAGARATHPDWFETGPPGTHGQQGGPGCYLSVWHPAARSAVIDLAGDLAGLLPDLDGLVLRHSYSHTDWIGFSERTRAACVRELRQDPLDLVRLGGAGIEPSLRVPLMRVAGWRHDAVDVALHAFVAAYRAARPDAEIWAWGRPETYLVDPLDRAQACEDWVGWLADGEVDGVFLEGPWQGRGDAAGAPAELYRMVGALVARVVPRPLVVPTIPSEDAAAEIDIVAQLRELQAQGPVPALGVVVKQPQHLADALELLRTFTPDPRPVR